MSAFNLNVNDIILFRDSLIDNVSDNNLFSDSGVLSDTFIKFLLSKNLTDSIILHDLKNIILPTSPFTDLIHDIAFGDNTFIAIGRNVEIARSTDSGATWSSLITNPFEYELYSIVYGNGVWLVGSDNGQIARSTDNGVTWSALLVNPFIKGIYGMAYGNSTFIAVGEINSELMRSTDNGITWGSLITNPFAGVGIQDIAFGNNTFVIVGDSGQIARSTDNGVTWGSLISNPFNGSNSIYDITFANGIFIAVGQNGQIARSTDNGVTWGSLINNPFNPSRSIWSIVYGNGWFVAVGDDGQIAYSTDGTIWSLLDGTAFTGNSLYGVAFGNNTFAIVDAEGLIYYTSISLFFDIGKGLLDTITLSDLIDKFDISKGLSDTITLNDLATIVLVYVRTFNDSVTLNDLATNVVDFLRTFNDSVTLSDLEKNEIGKILSDIISVLDYSEISKVLFWTIEDTITLSDVFSRVVDFERIITDSITVTDLITNIVDYIRTFTDTITLSELSIVGRYFTKRFLDHVHFTENINKTPGKELTDSITLVDNIESIIRIFNLDLDDTIILEDLSTLIRIFNQNLTDTVTLTDNLTSIVEFNKAINDSITVTDLLDSINEFYRTFDDTIILGADEFLQVIRIFNQNLDDTITTSDVIDHFDIGKGLSDTITLTDLLETLVIFNKGLSDTITLSDLGTAIRILNCNLDDTITLSDLASAIRILNCNLTDTITLTDFYSRVIDFERTLADTIPLISTFNRQVDYWRDDWSDTITVTDTMDITLVFMLILHDILALSDSVSTNLISNTLIIEQYLGRLRNVRSSLIDTYTPLFIQLKAEALAKMIEDKDFTKRILFGDTNYIGYDTIIELYWNVCLSLRTTGSMTYNLTSALLETWISFDNPVYEATGPLKSPTSRYITDNGLTLGATSIFQTLITQLGLQASSIGLVDSGYVYLSQLLATNNMVITDTNRKGTGVLGTRTRDSLPQITLQDLISPFYWKYQLGDGIVDTPDYWDATVLTNLQTIITSLTNLRTNYLTVIDYFYSHLVYNPYIIDKNVFSGFDANRTVFKTAIDNQITALTTYYNTLNTLKDDLTTNRIAINTNLINLLTDLNIYIAIDEARITEISSGNTIFGDPETADTVNFNRQMVISQLVQYPDGMIPVLYQMGGDLAVLNDLIVKDENLLLANGIGYDYMIPKSVIKSIYKTDSSTTVTLNWVSNFHPNQFKVYRKLASGVTSNAVWGEETLIHTLDQLTDTDPELLWTVQSYKDTTAIAGNIYVYRIQAVDTWWASHGGVNKNSKSDQSDVYLNGAVLNNCKISF